MRHRILLLAHECRLRQLVRCNRLEPDLGVFFERDRPVNTQLWPCIPELIYEWYSDVMPDRFVGYMMRRRFEKCSFHVPSRWRWSYHASWAIWCSLRQPRFRWSQSAGAPPLCCFPCLSQWGVLELLSTCLCKLAFFTNSTIYFCIFTQRLWKTKKNIDMHTIVAISYI